jgi:hypothetical protein
MVRPLPQPPQPRRNDSPQQAARLLIEKRFRILKNRHMTKAKADTAKAKIIEPNNRPTGKLPEGTLRPNLFSLEDELSNEHIATDYSTSDLNEIKNKLQIQFKKNEELEGKTPSQNKCLLAKSYILRCFEKIDLLELIRTKEGLRQFCLMYELKDSQESELVCELAGEHPKAVNALCRKTHKSFLQLQRLARKQHPAAIRVMANLAYDATEVLTELGKANPGLLKPAAEGKYRWPLFRSMHKKFQSVEDKLEAKFFEKIGLGEKSHIKIKGRLHYDPDHPATVVARKLLKYIEDIRKKWKTAPFIAVQDMHGAYQLHDPLVETAVNLPEEIQQIDTKDDCEQDDNSDGLAAWRKLAIAFLIESYPSLQKKSGHGVNELPPALSDLAKNTSGEHKREVILRIIRKHFNQLFAVKQRSFLQVS